MLRVILKRFILEAEEFIPEEKAGLRTGCSTTEQIFNLNTIFETYCYIWKTLIVSLLTSRRFSTGNGMQYCEQHWRKTKSMKICSKTFSSYLAKPSVEFVSKEVTRSALMFGSCRIVLCYLFSPISSWNRYYMITSSTLEDYKCTFSMQWKNGS